MKGTKPDMHILPHIGRIYQPIIFGIAAFFLIIMHSCKPEMKGSFVGEDAVSIAAYIENNQEGYSRYWELMLRTNLKNTLNAYNPNGNGYTVFMPSDKAFDRFIEESDAYNTFDDLLNDASFSNLLIRYHLVNTSIETNDFPYGALPDTTASGDFLTVDFATGLDSTIFRINNLASIIFSNIELVNGYIHVIDDVLEPIDYGSYDWIFENEDFSILAEALTITGLKDTMGIYRTTGSGKLIKNLYTLLAEPDSVFEKNGISNINDLIEKYQTPGLELTDIENEFYQFTAYHIMEGSYFLDKFSETNNYNTYANFPVQISSELEIKINPGSDTIDVVIIGNDTTIIKYVRIAMNDSNILTKNGAIHVLRDIMEVKTPGRTDRTFQFYNEPIINDLRKVAGEYDLIDPESMEVLFWTGTESIKYFKSDDSFSANSNDYIEINGNFTIDYKIPKILPGKWIVEIKAESSSDANATIQVYVDGKRMGSSFDLTAGGRPYKTFSVGTVEFLNYEEHTITVNSLLPGTFKWDIVQFLPE